MKLTNTHRNAGFGHLVGSRREQELTGVLGVIYDSVNFPLQQPSWIAEEGGCVLTVMMGGILAPWCVFWFLLAQCSKET